MGDFRCSKSKVIGKKYMFLCVGISATLQSSGLLVCSVKNVDLVNVL